VTRLDIAVGAFEHISSANVPGLTDQLLTAMPGLVEHRCSIGERGGFVQRLRRGTYAPHIIEHVALELQSMIGHDVGYGRTRGGDDAGEYTIVMEHLHDGVGMRAAALALEIVQRAFAGTLGQVAHAVAELSSIAAMPGTASTEHRILCAITGGAGRAETRDELVRLGAGRGELIMDLAPGYILHAGLPYAESTMAIVLDAAPIDVPSRYREPDRAQRLVSVVADAVDDGGVLIAPAKEWEVQDLARDAGCRVAIFATDADVTPRDTKVASAVALVDGGRILIDHLGERMDVGPLRADIPTVAQVAAALASHALTEMLPLETRGAPT
jgi:cyanophycin synthetase